jgi:hypothetical protein
MEGFHSPFYYFSWLRLGKDEEGNLTEGDLPSFLIGVYRSSFPNLN